MGKHRLFLGLLLALLLTLAPVSASAAGITPLSDFIYTVDDQASTVLLTEYTGTSSQVSVPGVYTLEGRDYAVILDAATVFRKNTAITAVTLGDVAFLDDSMAHLFSGCAGLTRATLSQVDTGSVTSMRSMFSNCSALSRLEGYTQWDTGALEDISFLFNFVQSLDTIDLRLWDLSRLKNSAWCFQYCYASRILLPDNLGIVSAGFMNHATSYAGEVFTLPAGVEKVGFAHTFYDFATDAFTEFQVHPDNPHYIAVDGILYSADGSQMLAVPRAKTFPEGVFAIPEGVTFLGELSFSRNYNIQTVLLPNSYRLAYVELYQPDYILFEDTGNLNAGLNLNIAIYCYTGVTAYGVKADNPHYRAIDGVLYTRDMTALTAVPTRYDKPLVIPEGVTDWNAHAMWCAGDQVDALMAGCDGVSIPASMVRIAQDQLDKLNRLTDRYPGFSISLAEGNPAYRIDSQGHLIPRISLENARITLSRDTFVYDGAAHTPGITLTLEGQPLTEGEDYTLRYENNRDAGTATVTATGLGLYGMTTTATFTIAPATPDYAPPAPVCAVYGQTLSSLPLPAGFAWEDPDAPVGPVGQQTAFLRYDPGDPNYAAVTAIPLTVQVSPKVLTAELSGLLPRYPFTGKAVTPAVTLMDGDTPIPQEEYRLSYSRNRFFGRAVLRVEDLPGGNYILSGSATFAIVPGPWLLAALGLVLALWAVLPALVRRRRAGPKA